MSTSPVADTVARVHTPATAPREDASRESATTAPKGTPFSPEFEKQAMAMIGAFGGGMIGGLVGAMIGNAVARNPYTGMAVAGFIGAIGTGAAGYALVSNLVKFPHE